MVLTIPSFKAPGEAGVGFDLPRPILPPIGVYRDGYNVALGQEISDSAVEGHPVVISELFCVTDVRGDSVAMGLEMFVSRTLGPEVDLHLYPKGECLAPWIEQRHNAAGRRNDCKRDERKKPSTETARTSVHQR